MTAAEIDRQLAAAPGIAERSQRAGDDGSIERHMLLKDDTFIRVVFPTTADTARPLSLSFALGDAADTAAIARSLESALGPAGWTRRGNANTVTRRIWGGQGRAEGAIQPDGAAAFVVRYGEVTQNVPAGVKAGHKVARGQIIGHVGKLVSMHVSMLHFEMYKGTATGPLTNLANKPYMRRSDLIDPTPFLDTATLDAGTPVQISLPIFPQFRFGSIKGLKSLASVL